MNVTAGKVFGVPRTVAELDKDLKKYFKNLEQ